MECKSGRVTRCLWTLVYVFVGGAISVASPADRPIASAQSTEICPGLAFSAPVAYSTGGRPFAVAIADLDLDGLPDLAVANMSSNDLSLFRGTTGAHTALPWIEAPRLPVSLAVGDFNLDGFPDLAVANAGSNTVTIFDGLAGGALRRSTEIAVELLPVSIVAGDLDGDGRPDLVVANYGDHNLSILLAGDAGEFHAATGSPTFVGYGPEAAALADLDQDGSLDIVVAVTGLNTLATLVGNGNGTFRWGQDHQVGRRPRQLLVADITADGRPDVAVSNKDSGTISVLIGYADGTLREAAGSPVRLGDGPEGLAAADFDGDGNVDLAIALTDTVRSNLAILLGRGDGTFQPPKYVFAGPAPWALAAGDLNHDLRPDIAVTNVNANTISILLNICAP